MVPYRIAGGVRHHGEHIRNEIRQQAGFARASEMQN